MAAPKAEAMSGHRPRSRCCWSICIVVGVLLVRKSLRDSVAPPASTANAEAAPASTARETAAGPPLATAHPGAGPAAPPAMLRPAEPATDSADPGRNPLEAETVGTSPTLDPRMAAEAAAAPPGPPAVTSRPGSRGSVLYESLPESATVGARPYPPPAGASRLDSGSGSRLPSADELAASGVPGLNLDLHVYAIRPAERLVFINSRQYREGDTLHEGPVVREITPGGVVLEYNGRDYLLTHN